MHKVSELEGDGRSKPSYIEFERVLCCPRLVGLSPSPRGALAKQRRSILLSGYGHCDADFMATRVQGLSGGHRQAQDDD